jgi:hypothetical protein
LPTVAPSQPKTITLEPLGYVEKADGQVEAIISVRDRVHVVNEGETIEDNFKVAKIGFSAVELVENSAHSPVARVLAETEQARGQAPASESPPAPPGPVLDVVSKPDANHQFAADSAARRSQPSEPQELGYVERADGRVEAIVAEGEHVRLSQANKSFAKEFHGPIASPANVEVAESSPPTINPPESPALESQPHRTKSLAQEAGEVPLAALGPEPSTADKPQGTPASDGGSRFEPASIVQPEPLADYSGNRFEASIPRTLVPPSPSVEPSPPSDGSGNESAVMPLGFVQKADGEKEAIVEVFDQVYLAHEGELFAEKYRALRVTPFSVEIVEESKEGSALPSEIERDSEAVRPPISWWRGPPLPTGFSGTDPPVEVGKTEGSAAGKPAVNPSRPPPEHLVESCERLKGLETPRTGLKGVRLAERSAQTDTRSPPSALNTVGFVEKASGETEAIVADEGGVYLVPSGRVSLDNSKAPNQLPGLEISPLGIRVLAFPDILSEFPAATFQIESAQIRR